MSGKPVRLWILVAALAVSPAASAGEWGKCNGYDIKWRSTKPVLMRLRCTVPDSGPKNALYWNGTNQWESIQTISSDHRVDTDLSHCNPAHGNGISEIGIVPESFIDGNEGLTVLAFNKGCNWCAGWLCSTMDIVEADAMIRDNFPSYDPPPWEGADQVGAWDTMLHEFGHFYGGLAEDRVFFSIMGKSNSPLLGGNIPNDQRVVLMPRDRRRIVSLYGKSHEIVNVAASPQAIFQNPYRITLGDQPALVYACRGSRQSVHFTTLNQSTSFISFSAVLRMTTDFSGYTPGAGDLPLLLIGESMGMGEAGDQVDTFTIPNDFPIGQVGYVFLDLDTGHELSETSEADNSIRLFKIFYVVC